MYSTVASQNTYKGVTFKLERREIWTPARAMQGGKGITRVWCWEITSGPGRGDYGGNCSTKVEVMKTVKRVINRYAAEEAAKTA